MTDEEKQELEELKAKEEPTDADTARIIELEQADISPDNEFNEAFDEALAEDDPDSELKDDKKSKLKKDESGNDDDDDDVDSILNSISNDADDVDNPEKRVADLEAELASNNQRMSSWEGRIKAANKAKDEAEAKLNGKKLDPGKVDEKAPGEDEEADAILSEFIDEFPSLEQPIKIMVRKIADKMIESKMGELTPKIESIEERTNETASEEHFATIKKAHKDYKKIYDSGALNTWIKGQPKFLQAGMEVVIEDGTAEEIIEMFDAYKKTVKHTQSDNRDKTKKDKLKNLEAVDQSTGGPPKDRKKVDKNNFNEAWDEAVSKD